MFVNKIIRKIAGNFTFMIVTDHENLDKQISCEELEKVLVNPLFSEVQFVGINGGEPTLRRDAAALIDVLFRKLPKLGGVSLITNAINSGEVIDSVEGIGQVVSKYGGSLDVMVSFKLSYC